MKHPEEMWGNLPLSSVVADCTLNWQRLNNLLHESIGGTAVTDKVSIESVELSADEELVYIVASLNARRSAVLKGECRFSPGSEEHPVMIESFEFRLEQGSLLARGANWLLNTLAGDSFKTKMLDRLQAAIDQIIRDAIDKHTTITNHDGFQIVIDPKTYQVTHVDWDAEQLMLRLKIDGWVRLQF